MSETNSTAPLPDAETKKIEDELTWRDKEEGGFRERVQKRVKTLTGKDILI